MKIKSKKMKNAGWREKRGGIQKRTGMRGGRYSQNRTNKLAISLLDFFQKRGNISFVMRE